jgi:UDP-N-acetylglucosamine 2-epimerase (non-hydrolysing)
MGRLKVVSVVGTRPEAIKMAPVIVELGRRRDQFDQVVVSTAQHREMLDQVMTMFGITADIDLELMQPNQGLAAFASRAISGVASVLADVRPHAVLVQGDTTTVMAAALAAFYAGVRVGHVEAGLRSFDRNNPFPEEINRRVAGCLADVHFAPTDRARANLLREGVVADDIIVTGNTIVDALRSVDLGTGPTVDQLRGADLTHKRLILVTAHRRENHGAPLEGICTALRSLARSFEDVAIVYPVHLNPNVATVVRRELGGEARIHLTDPLSYRDLLSLMSRSYVLLTDSGGIQEEAPSLHKPVLVLRDVTERPEVVDSGAGKLVGTDPRRIVDEVTRLLTDRRAYEIMSRAENPFGDGRAAVRIADALLDRFGRIAARSTSARAAARRRHTPVRL